jgi:hypothetical protein
LWPRVNATTRATQQVRNFGPHPLAEAVGVVCERERARAPEVEQRDLDATPGQSQATRRRAREKVRDPGPGGEE